MSSDEEKQLIYEELRALKKENSDLKEILQNREKDLHSAMKVISSIKEILGIITVRIDGITK